MDLIRKEIIHRSMALTEKTSLKDWTTQSGPPLSPPSSRRPEPPLSSSEAGTEPLVAEPTLRAEAYLKRGLAMEVKQVPELFVGFRIGL
jgi:hypothetical protein